MNKIQIKGPKVGLFSDIHIGLGQDSSIWHKNILEFADWVVDFYERKGISEILIPGDIFHNRNEISVNTLSVAQSFFKKFEGFKLYISTGNHDCYYKDRTDINSISMLGGWDNIVLVDKQPQVFSILNSDKTLSMIPWGIDIPNIPQSDICVGHFEITSFKMNSFKVCDHGWESTDILSKSPFIITGHFHTPCLRNYNKGKILYLGSPYQQNFGDAGDTRGVYILNLLNDEIEFTENNVSPTHQKILLSSLLNGETTTTTLKNIIPNNMVSLVIDTNLEPSKLSLLSAKIQKLNPKFFRTDYQNTDQTLNLSTSGTSQYDSIDIPQNINDFVEALDILHKNETCLYLNELYHKLAI
jgi:DNA repair exonuclease SbcCD nuclease subunit